MRRFWSLVHRAFSMVTVTHHHNINLIYMANKRLVEVVKVQLPRKTKSFVSLCTQYV